MSGLVKVGGAWKDVSGLSVNIGGTWKDVTSGSVNIAGTWKEFYAPATGDIGDFDLLQSEVLTSSAASVTFSGLSAYASTYQHLQIRGTFRDTNASVARLGLRINGVTGSNYMSHVLFARGTGITSEAVNSGAYDTQIRLSQDSPASSTTANTFGSTVVDFLDAYSTSKFKTVRALSGFAANASLINLTSGFLNSTSAISSITLFSLQGTALATGSRFSLYGVKKAA